MKLRWIDSKGVRAGSGRAARHAEAHRRDSLARYIPEWSEDAKAIVTKEFQFHPMAIAKSKDRKHVPRVHVYPDHVFIVMHTPEIGSGGQVHYLELDQIH